MFVKCNNYHIFMDKLIIIVSEIYDCYKILVKVTFIIFYNMTFITTELKINLFLSNKMLNKEIEIWKILLNGYQLIWLSY